MANSTAAGPLDGIKVVDMSTMISGPLAAMMLADQGADVIKVESPGIGDIMRMLGSQKGGMTGIFANNNRGKRSIVVDLKQDAGADIVRRLADKTTAYTALQAITAALFARATGKADGQHIELAMLDTAIAFLWPDGGMDAGLLDDDAIRAPTLAANYAVTPLADGFAAVSAVSDSEFSGLCAALGRPEIAEDPRFSNMPSRSGVA